MHGRIAANGEEKKENNSQMFSFFRYFCCGKSSLSPNLGDGKKSLRHVLSLEINILHLKINFLFIQCERNFLFSRLFSKFEEKKLGDFFAKKLTYATHNKKGTMHRKRSFLHTPLISCKDIMNMHQL